MIIENTISLKDSWLDLVYDALNDNMIVLSVAKTIVYKKSRKWEIHLNTNRYIHYQDILRIQEKFNEKFFDIEDINIRITCLKSVQEVAADFDTIWVDLIEYIKLEMPSVSPWLVLCSYQWKGNGLVITVGQAAEFDILTHKAVHHYIEQWLNSTFQLSVKVSLSENHIQQPAKTQDYLLKKEKENSELVRNTIEAHPVNFNEQADKSSNRFNDNSSTVILGKRIKDAFIAIEMLREDSGRIAIEGNIFDMDTRELKGGKYLISLDVTDYTSSITAKVFLDKEKAQVLLKGLEKGRWYKIKGDCQYDKYQKEIVIIINDINSAASRTRIDNAPVKRVELHLHTQMSSMDAVTPVKQLIERAALWEHDAIAITDHGVVQAFPEAYSVGKKNGVKILFGVEAYLINDCKPIITNSRDEDFNQTFVVLDIETTGLNAKNNEIIEIGAVKIHGKKIIDSFESFVAPTKSIPAKITELTGINDDMVAGAPLINEVLQDFIAFCGNAILVAHNASFDIGFIKENAKVLGCTIDLPILDTLSLSRELIKDIKRYKLNIVADYLGVTMKKHHRAMDDAEATGNILLKLLEMLENLGIYNLLDINNSFSRRTNLNGLESYHAVILVKNAIGLKNLYKLISISHLEYYYRKPRMPKSILAQYRDGLIIGSGCEAGELYKAVLKDLPEEEINEITEFYDYLEIQPLGNNQYLVREEHVANDESLRMINRRIVALGKAHNKRVVATGDVHFLDPHDEYFRRILMSGQGFGDADLQAPLYFKTTEEMLEEFSYLGEDSAYDVVITAPRSIADEIEAIKPVPEQLFPPEIPGAEDEIRKMSLETAATIYGTPLPEVVEKRLTKELNSIIGNGFAVLYLIAHKLVKKSLSDGYLVGSRGSVGSSFVATMTGITEVNPLPPHYVCSNCKHTDFEIDTGVYGCGADLPDKVCPCCGTQYTKAGFDIPFEVFLGFKGDKVPDIDLNFSGEYQSVAHKYTEELFGEGHVFRAGTIGTIAEKTAFGFVKKYLDEKTKIASNAEIKRLVAGCSGVKRTTGQHPGGILVVPKSKEIYEFTPIQHPADDKSSGIITSHFDFHAIHDTLVKLDILGHDDPTVIKMLEDITGIDARTIPIGEKTTMKIFSGTEPLQISPEDINSPIGTFGIPEFGTKFVRQMLLDTKPTTFAELIRISGLSHGTDVWVNNAQDLIRNNVSTLSEVISTRDDIMVNLIYKGLEPTSAFKIMESVRKGKGLTSDMEEEMRSNNVSDWYIESCKKIKYMFPKAHAAAYVIMAFRIAYFKVYYPEAFYAAYFTVRADDFDAALILGGTKVVKDKIRDFEARGNDLSTKEKNLLTILEVALEMYMRGLHFVPIDLYLSHSDHFLLTKNGIRPPLNALQGVGINAAKSIQEARASGEFISIENLRERAKVTKTVIETLRDHNVLKNMQETSQISLF